MLYNLKQFIEDFDSSLSLKIKKSIYEDLTTFYDVHSMTRKLLNRVLEKERDQYTKFYSDLDNKVTMQTR